MSDPQSLGWGWGGDTGQGTEHLHSQLSSEPASALIHGVVSVRDLPTPCFLSVPRDTGIPGIARNDS